MGFMTGLDGLQLGCAFLMLSALLCPVQSNRDTGDRRNWEHRYLFGLPQAAAQSLSLAERPA